MIFWVLDQLCETCRAAWQSTCQRL